MKDLILIQLYKLSKYGLINNLYVLYYKSAIKFLEIIFSRIDYIEQVGLKGSFGKVYFVPVFSDLDFFVVGNKNAVTIKKLDRLFKFTSLIIPIVKDYDFYTKTEAKLLLSFGDLKFIDPGSWTTLKGESFSSQYRYHPRKFYLDIVHEIHFQFEWLFRNLQTRTSKEVYKSLNIQRQYDKVSDLLNYLHDHQSYTIRRRPFKPNYRWVDYSNEYIIQKFNDLLERSVQIRTLKKIFFKEFQGRDLEPILEQEYFQNNLVLMDSGFVYSGKLHYFTRENFELFYFSGAIDSFMVYDWARENEDDKLGCFFVRAQYYCRLIEGRFNSRHDRIYLEKQLPEFLNDAKFVENMIPNYLTPPSNVFGKKVVLRVFEARKRNGYELEKEIMGTNLSSETTNLSFLNVVLNDGSFQNKNFQLLENRSGSVIESSILNIYLRTIQEHLCYEGTLLEYGISWCFGAKEILVLDYRLELSDQVLQTFLDESILDGNFKITRPTHQFVQNYIIAASKISIQKIPFSKLTNLNFYIAEIIQAIIQGKVGELDISQKQMLKEWDVFKYLGDVEYWSIDLSTKFCELNTTALNIIPLINSLIEQNKFGIFNVKEKEKDLWLEIGYLLSSNNYYAAKTSVLNNLERFRLSAGAIFLYRDIEIVVQSHQECSLVMTPTEGADTCFHFLKEGFYRGKLKKKYSVSESGFYTFDFLFRSENLNRVSLINIEISEERFKNSGSKKDIIKLQLNTYFKLIAYLEKGINVVEVDFTIQTKNSLDLSFGLELNKLIKYWDLDEHQMTLKDGAIIPNADLLSNTDEILCTEFQLYKIDQENKLNFESSSCSFPSHIDFDHRVIYAYATSHGFTDLRLNFNFDPALIKCIRSFSKSKKEDLKWVERSPKEFKFETNSNVKVDAFLPLSFSETSKEVIGKKIISFQPFDIDDSFRIFHLDVDLTSEFSIFVFDNYIEIYPNLNLSNTTNSNDFRLVARLNAEPNQVYGLFQEDIKLVRPEDKYFQYQKFESLDSIKLYPGFHKFVLYFDEANTTDLEVFSKNKNISFQRVHVENSQVGVYEVFVPTLIDELKLDTQVRVSKVDHLFYPAD